MSNRTYIIVATLTVMLAELLICYAVDIHVACNQTRTQESVTFCCRVQQGSNGECK